ncbi:MAG: hypothetical protein NTW86_08960 [Candidatus Sumerlaeota bacterium]|nr:hypothetical protein [Candidatus Sumerlaeota bacterium]
MLLGGAIGWGVCEWVARSKTTPVVVSWEPFAVSVGFAIVAGLVFGVQPARRAARLQPAATLR